MSIKLELTNGDFVWATLPAPFWVGKEQLSPGVTLHALYRGARSGRMVAETYSCWVDYRGKIAGTQFREITESEWINFCDLVGVDPQLTPEDL